MCIYYRFYREDFVYDLKENLHDENAQDNLDKHIFSIIKDEPLEFYQYIKGVIPKWFQFLLLETLYDKNVLPDFPEENLDNMTLRNYDYADFLNYLLIMDIQYQEFYIYSSMFENSGINSKMYWMYIENMKCKEINLQRSIHARHKYRRFVLG